MDLGREKLNELKKECRERERKSSKNQRQFGGRGIERADRREKKAGEKLVRNLSTDE